MYHIEILDSLLLKFNYLGEKWKLEGVDKRKRREDVHIFEIVSRIAKFI